MNKLHDLVATIKLLADEHGKAPSKEELIAAGASDYSIRMAGGFFKLLDLAGMKSRLFDKNPPKDSKPYRILVLDIELFPMQSFHWQMWDQNIPVDMIIEDWSVACWAAKWFHDDKIIFRSVQKHCPKKKRNDKEILIEMRDLLDEADVVLTQNGKKFDIKKLFYRFIKHKIKPPSRFMQLDTKIIAKRTAALSSNSLAFMSREINEKYKKLDHGKFPGNKIFLECMKGNEEAWDEMTTYNIHDVLATQEFFEHISPYDQSINWNVFTHNHTNKCFCGSMNFDLHPTKKKHTRAGRYSLFICRDCGRDWAHPENELSKDKRQTMLR
jgi:DNA polymerase elongation subunit (family B)